MAAFTRRKFLAAGGVVAAGAVAAAATQHPSTLLSQGSSTGRVESGKGILILVTLYGGNDGLNTLIPSNDPRYLALRPNLAYSPNEALPLGQGMGLHPNLKGLKALWDSKELAIVRGVGYPTPVLSHFRSMDIWQTASPESASYTGWLGRWLDTGSDPMRALSIGPTVPLALTGEKETGTALAARVTHSPGGPRLEPVIRVLDALGPDRSDLAARVARSGSDLLAVQHDVANLLGSGGPSATTSQVGGGGLSADLGLVARLIKAGSPTRVYQVSMSGFDNHAQEKATHANLMAKLDNGISSFLAALKGDPHSAGVVLMTYSEFGRRPAENASGGTDHGTAAPLFVAGPGVRGGRFYGDEPSLIDLADGNLKFTTDFRSVYATVLERVLGVDPKAILGRSLPLLAFV
jgi:uncharacterized protein (DUF1501 family)